MSSNPEVRVFDDLVELSRAMAERFCQAAQRAVATRGLFTAALSGGSTPRRFLQLLARPSFAGRVDWASTRLFQVDERTARDGSRRPHRLSFSRYRRTHGATALGDPEPRRKAKHLAHDSDLPRAQRGPGSDLPCGQVMIRQRSCVRCSIPRRRGTASRRKASRWSTVNWLGIWAARPRGCSDSRCRPAAVTLRPFALGRGSEGASCAESRPLKRQSQL